MLSSYAMEKLIELINEYYKRRYSTDKFKVDRFTNYAPNDWGYFNYVGEEYGGISEADIISKRYNFIERLVNNDKVDADGLNYKYMDAVYELELAGILKKENRTQYLSDFLIMLLSIQDNPINFLVSILK